MKIAEFRKQYPQYDDLSDGEVAKNLHTKYYSDMSFDDFASKFGVAPPARTWTEAITDTARDATAGTLEAASGLTGLFRRAGSATQTGQANLSDIETGQSAVDTSSQISQPGKIEKALSGTAEVIRDEQSDKRKWQRQALQDTDGAWEAAKFLVTNPSAIGGLMAESAPGSLLAGGVGGFVGKGVLAATGNKAVAMSAAGIGAMTGEGILSAGSLASDIEKLLDKQGIMDPEVRSKAINIAYASGLATGYLGKIGKGIEVMPFMRDSIKEALAKAVPKAMLKEGAEEFAQGFQEAVAKNLALGQAGAKDEDGKAITNLTQGAAKDATIGALAGVGTGGVMPLASRGLDRLQPTPPAAGTPAPPAPPSPSTIPLSGDLEADLDAINNAPITPIADAFKSAEMRDTRDLQDQAIALDGGDNASELVSGNTPASQGTPAIQAAGNSVPQTPDAVQNAAENLPAVDAAARTDVANVAPDMAQKAGNDAISAGRGAAGDILTAANSGVSSADGQPTVSAATTEKAPADGGVSPADKPALLGLPNAEPRSGNGDEAAKTRPTGDVSGSTRPDRATRQTGSEQGTASGARPELARGAEGAAAPTTGPAAQNERANAAPTGQVNGTVESIQERTTGQIPQGGVSPNNGAANNQGNGNAVHAGSGAGGSQRIPASQRQPAPASGANQSERRAAARNYDADVNRAFEDVRALQDAAKTKEEFFTADEALFDAEALITGFRDYTDTKSGKVAVREFSTRQSAQLFAKSNKLASEYAPRESGNVWVLTKPTVANVIDQAKADIAQGVSAEKPKDAGVVRQTESVRQTDRTPKTKGAASEVTNSLNTSEERVKETAESAPVETQVETPVKATIASQPESNTPANPLAAPVPKAGLTIKDIPKSALKRIYVDMPVMEDDGTVTMEKRAAKDALASLSRQEKAYRALRACVG